MVVRTVVQHGPKDKKVAAFAIDWPGWSRGAKTPDSGRAARGVSRAVPADRGPRRARGRVRSGRRARDRRGPRRRGIDRLLGHLLRPVLVRAGADARADELERKLALLEAAWRFFDDVAARVSARDGEGSARRRSQSRRDRPPRPALDSEQSAPGRRSASGAFADDSRGLVPEASAACKARGGHARLQRGGEDGERPKLDDRVAPAAHRLPRARSRVGDGGQGPLAPERTRLESTPGERSAPSQASNGPGSHRCAPAVLDATRPGPAQPAEEPVSLRAVRPRRQRVGARVGAALVGAVRPATDHLRPARRRRPRLDERRPRGPAPPGRQRPPRPTPSDSRLTGPSGCPVPRSRPPTAADRRPPGGRDRRRRGP